MDVWPLRPNWREPLRISHTYLTEVISSRSGKEQRRAMRQTPRRTVEFTVTTERDRFRTLTRAFATSRGPLLAWPDPTRAVRVSGALVGGGSVIPVASAPEWAVTGFDAVLVQGDRSELVTVLSASPTAITIEGTFEPWPVGTKLCPAVVGRLPPNDSATQYAPGIIEAPIIVLGDPGWETARYAGEPPVTWNGREVFVMRTNWADPRDLSLTRDYQTVDYGFGRAAAFFPVAFAVTNRVVDLQLRSKSEAEDALKFFERCKGQLKEFYAPTDQPDMLLAEAAGNGSSSFVVQGSDVLSAYADDPVHKAVCIKMRNGQRVFRAVHELAADGPNTAVELETALPFGIDPNTVEVISWMPVMRFATDTAVFEWLTDEVSRVRFNFKTLPDAPAE